MYAPQTAGGLCSLLRSLLADVERLAPDRVLTFSGQTTTAGALAQSLRQAQAADHQDVWAVCSLAPATAVDPTDADVQDIVAAAAAVRAQLPHSWVKPALAIGGAAAILGIAAYLIAD